MLDKIRGHEASNMHIQATAVYMRWKSGKTVDKDDEKEIRNNALFWVKVLDRIITIILTLATITLAFRGHDEHVHDDIYEDGNFLGMVCTMSQYDETLAKVISFLARATKYLSRVSSSFSQVYKLLIVFATIPVTLATAERSFSKLKLIKTYLRSQMFQERLSGLALLSIENKAAKAVDKKQLIHLIANAKARMKEQIEL